MSNTTFYTPSANAATIRNKAETHVVKMAILRVLVRRRSVTGLPLLTDLAHLDLCDPKKSVINALERTQPAEDGTLSAAAQRAINELLEAGLVVSSARGEHVTYSLSDLVRQGGTKESDADQAVCVNMPIPLRVSPGLAKEPNKLLTLWPQRISPLALAGVASISGLCVAGCMTPAVYQHPRYSYFVPVDGVSTDAGATVPPELVASKKTSIRAVPPHADIPANPVVIAAATEAPNTPPIAVAQEDRKGRSSETMPSSIAASAPVTAPLKLDTQFASAKRIVPFEYSRAELSEESLKIFNELLPLAKQAQAVKVRGTTDSSGVPAVNKSLAISRAVLVTKRLISNGVPATKIRTTYCTTCFIASNSSDQGRRSNRRVDIELILPSSKVAALPSTYTKSIGGTIPDPRR